MMNIPRIMLLIKKRPVNPNKLMTLGRHLTTTNMTKYSKTVIREDPILLPSAGKSSPGANQITVKKLQ